AGPHIKALSRISRLVRRDEIRERLVSARDADDFLRALRDAEGACASGPRETLGDPFPNPMSHRLPTSLRSSLAGTLRRADAGARGGLAGWCPRRRVLGGLVSVDLRARSGRIRLSFGPAWTPPDALERASRLGAETVIAVEGDVVARPAGNVNPDLPTGEVEVHVHALEFLADAATPPTP